MHTKLLGAVFISKILQHCIEKLLWRLLRLRDVRLYGFLDPVRHALRASFQPTPSPTEVSGHGATEVVKTQCLQVYARQELGNCRPSLAFDLLVCLVASWILLVLVVLGAGRALRQDRQRLLLQHRLTVHCAGLHPEHFGSMKQSWQATH